MSDKVFVESVGYTERTIILKRMRDLNGKTLYSWLENGDDSLVFTSLEEAQDYMRAKSTIHRIQFDEASA